MASRGGEFGTYKFVPVKTTSLRKKCFKGVPMEKVKHKFGEEMPAVAADNPEGEGQYEAFQDRLTDHAAVAWPGAVRQRAIGAGRH